MPVDAAALFSPRDVTRSRSQGRGDRAGVAYRPEIDGLRAVAVAGVIAHHANVAFVPGGFVGVDVFFVISGFLISQLLLAELAANGRVDLAAFWARRARRLLPAAGLVILATAALSVAFLPAADLGRAGGDLMGAALYVVNWRFVGAATDYFASDTPSVALHYWSLSVEEQFYLVWPLLLSALFVFVCRRNSSEDGRRRLAVCFAVIACASLAYCIAVTSAFQPLGFFDAAARAWQFALGGLAAVATRWVAGRRIRIVSAWMGVAAILAAMALFTDEMLYPGWRAILPTAGAALLLLSLGDVASKGGLAHRALASAPMTFLGKVSYALYLWHWPILYFAPNLLPEALGSSPVWPILLSLVLATATHFALENPIRFSGALGRRVWASLGVGGATSVAAAGCGLAVLVFAGTLGVEIAPGRRLTPDALKSDVTEAYAAGCHLPAPAVQSEDCSFGPADARHTVFLFGDSHAAHWSPAVRAAAESVGDWRLLHRTKSFCPSTDIAVWNYDLDREYSECAQWRDAVLEEIRAARPDLVLVANSSIYAPHGPGAGPPSEARLAELRAGEEAFMRRLLAAGPGRVVVIADVPELPAGEPETCLFEREPAEPSRCAWPLDEARSNFPYTDYEDFEGVAVMDLVHEICDGDRCPAIREGTVVMRDAGHISRSFALTLADQFEPLLARAGSD